MSTVSFEDRERENWMAEGVRWFVAYFLGASAVTCVNREHKVVTLRFDSRSPSGATEQRVYSLNANMMKPEELVEIILQARRRQAWYARQSDSVDVSDVDPNIPSVGDSEAG